MRPRTFVTVAIVLFWGTMMFLHVKQEYFPSDQNRTSTPYSLQDLADFLTREDHINYQIRDGQGQPIGTNRRVVVQREPTIRVRQTMQLNLADLLASIQGNGQLQVDKSTEYSPKGRLNSFRIEFRVKNAPLFQNILRGLTEDGKLIVNGKRDGDQISVDYGQLGKSDTFSSGETFQVSSSFNPMGAMLPPRPGSSRSFTMMDPLNKQARTVQMKTSKTPETISWNERKVDVYRVRMKQERSSVDANVRGTAWITRTGELIRQKVKHPLLPSTIQFVRTTPLQ